jgi:hypothetical protein
MAIKQQMHDRIHKNAEIYYKRPTKGKRNVNGDKTDCGDCDYDDSCEHEEAGNVFSQCAQGFCYKLMDPLYVDLLKAKEAADGTNKNA